MISSNLIYFLFCFVEDYDARIRYGDIIFVLITCAYSQGTPTVSHSSKPHIHMHTGEISML